MNLSKRYIPMDIEYCKRALWHVPKKFNVTVEIADNMPWYRITIRNNSSKVVFNQMVHSRSELDNFLTKVVQWTTELEQKSFSESKFSNGTQTTQVLRKKKSQTR